MNGKNIQVIEKMLSEIDVASSLMGGIDLDAFLGDEMRKRAVCMTVINVGELVKNLDDDFRATYENVPWRAIAGFRDVAAHKYQTLRMEDVYATVSDDFPSLQAMLEEIIA